jgi:hypothetical protein
MFPLPAVQRKRRRTILQLEGLEDRTAPAAVLSPSAAALIVAPATTESAVTPAPANTTTSGGTTQQGTAAALTTGTPNLLSVANNIPGTAGTTTGAASAAAFHPVGPSVTVPVTPPTPTTGSVGGAVTTPQFNFAQLPGGPINTPLGGGAGVLASGAMVTNSTAGLPLGGVITVPDSTAVVGSIDPGLSVPSLAVRTLFPADETYAGNTGQPAPGPDGAARPAAAVGMTLPQGTTPLPQAVPVPTQGLDFLPPATTPPGDLFDDLGDMGSLAPPPAALSPPVPRVVDAYMVHSAPAGARVPQQAAHDVPTTHLMGAVAVFITPEALRRRWSAAGTLVRWPARDEN